MKGFFLILLVFIASPSARFSGRTDCIIGFARGKDPAPLLARLAGQIPLEWKFDRVLHNMTAVRLPAGTDIDSFILAMEADPRVSYCEPDLVWRTTRWPDDPLFPAQWGLRPGGQQGAGIGILGAWRMFSGTRAVLLAIIDTGIDYLHPDLVPNMWRNPGEVPANGRDDDQNGYIDDIVGWNFATFPTGSAELRGPEPMDRNNHGTHIAGIIGAATHNGTGISGINRTCRLMAVKGLSDIGWGFTSDLAAGIYYAVDNGARVINASWGSYDSSRAMFEAITYAAGRGVLFVAGAGNHNRDNDQIPFYPASYGCDNIIAVAATDSSGGLAPFSHFGRRSVDIAAPGMDILSAWPDSTYGRLTGTSQAAPHVAGVLALMMGAAPGCPCGWYRDALLASVEVRGDMTGRIAGGGRLDAAAALRAVLTGRNTAPGRGGVLLPGYVVRYFRGGKRN